MTDATGNVSWKYPNYRNLFLHYLLNRSIYYHRMTLTLLRINNQVSSMVIPDAATNKDRMLYLINWPGNSKKALEFLNDNDLFDITTNSTVIRN